jgi:membrane protease YdiL (CAAX protease family)
VPPVSAVIAGLSPIERPWRRIPYSMCQLPVTRLRNLALFVIIFGAAWTAFVVVVWKLDWVPAQLRPRLRTLVWCAAVVAWIAWQRSLRPLRWLGLARVPLRVIAVSTIAIAILFFWNLWRARIFDATTGKLAALDAGAYVWIVVGDFVEELVFRGVIQTGLVEALLPLLAIATAALQFLAFHVPGWILLTIPIDAGVVSNMFFVGAICDALRHCRGSLWSAVAAHCANNFGVLH